MLNDFLFEIGCEELPFAAVGQLGQALADNVAGALDKAGLSCQAIKAFSSPRRLALLITQLADEQPRQKLSRRGPALNAAYDEQGQPTKALLGFVKSCQIEIEALTREKTDKGEWLVYESEIEGAKTKALLPAILQQAISSLPIAKPMRWGQGDIEFVRPVHWVVMLYGEEPVAGEILGVQAGQTTYGHRFHHPEGILIQKPQDYETILDKAYVMADYTKRRTSIIQQVQALADKKNAKAIMPESLIDEVTAIVEWPVALLASFSPEFLEVPAEALIASMQLHQKCFALQDRTGKLLPCFVTVSNIHSLNPSQVIAGNEKVMRARLSDAAFFFQQDKRQPLSQRMTETAKVVFQQRLGSLQDKATRMQHIMEKLATSLQLDVSHAKRAAVLSKCDLVTGMVGEFPELQGLMGYYYALHDGEALAVAQALNEQYLPRFSGDILPESTLGMALSLADRLDTLVGIFAIGEKPTGVKDPFKLRRHALAVVRLLQSTPATLSLAGLIAESLDGYSQSLERNDLAMAELKSFILERLQSYYQGQGISADLVHAVRARQDDWLYDLDKRIHALADFVKKPEASALSAACKRVSNILQQAASSQQQSSPEIDRTLLEEGAEKALYSHLQNMAEQIKPCYEQGDYQFILNQLASLREPVDAFFDQVMVMVDDPKVKMNRLNVLTRLQALLQGVADISLLQLH